MKELSFYHCNLCGNLICMVNDSGVTPTCCEEEMELVTANTVEPTAEKHIPVIQQNGNKVLILASIVMASTCTSLRTQEGIL